LQRCWWTLQDVLPLYMVLFPGRSLMACLVAAEFFGDMAEETVGGALDSGRRLVGTMPSTSTSSWIGYGGLPPMRSMTREAERSLDDVIVIIRRAKTKEKGEEDFGVRLAVFIRFGEM